MSKEFDIIVIGAGAAGMMCALTAGNRGRRVLLLDHADKVGKKIIISGGGRCNFTNIDTRADRFLSENRHFCKSALSRYTPRNIIELLEKHNIAYHEKKLGQLFCDDSAEQVVDMLVQECDAAGVKTQLDTTIETISHSNGRHHLDGHQGKAGGKERYSAEKLVIATGGLSVPKLGATNFAYEQARKFGLNIIPCRPALVPLTFTDNDLGFMRSLSGISIDCTVRCHKTTFRENLLFTHRGLSGPAILQISSYWQHMDSLHIDLLPDMHLDAVTEWLINAKTQRPKAELKTIIAEKLPTRFALGLVERKFDNRVMAEQSNKNLKAVAAFLKNWALVPTGTEGYRIAEVTVGGIDTADLSSKTMEAKIQPGLYFIGECVDVTGWLGGYNFQWAWASGYAAGHAV
ncbi:MAG: aminoacetone oxidase family FAD-binding enzyme [Kordiimonas sp.]|nr:aminoacetone oxidase family FAD-binding enzyme [Kordiimonas sp.]|tara:strand:+ start:3460 stop:4668 length:1209 start_codon:yes stop_codon:yes gene_type:complete